ncbi:MAG: hypothetical protein M1812_001829 [Candelaria pacifica]|nr:MAG: hypothetical protein M1812_001829 [Candelaria pacifica]
MSSHTAEALEQWKTCIVVVVLVYPVLVALLRFRRVRAMPEKFGYTTRESLSKMTAEDAYKIQVEIAELEFPSAYEKALQFALFKTYGIPSISKLLVATRQLSQEAKASKRYADTAVLITELMANPPSSERTSTAIGRMNYIHSVYQNAGKISNEDLLYTLSLFALEPIRWIKMYEWRELIELERAAIGTFWKGIGNEMSIDYSELRSAQHGWRDGLHWLEDVHEWSQAYEERCMVPDVNNRQTADETTKLLLYLVPYRFRGAGKHAVSVLLNDRLREAMMYEKPPRGYTIFVEGALHLRKLFLRHLALPRFKNFREVSEGADPKSGCFYYKTYAAHPWYVKPTLSNRWGFEAWMTWALGGSLPGDEGEKFKPKGYHIQDIGPDSMQGKGLDAVSVTKARIMERNPQICPFAFA